MNRVTRFWSETAPTVRWTTYVSVPLGLALGTFGLIGDEYGWWDNRAFLTNLLSSMTSVLFGIPLALVVLSWLGTHQAEVLERRAALRRADQVSREMHQKVMGIFTSSDPFSVRGELMTLRRHNGQRSSVLHSLAAAETVSDELRERWREAQREWDEAANTCFANRTPGALMSWSGDLAFTWRTLDDEIRPRMVSLGMKWLPSTTHVEIQRAMEILAASPRALFPATPSPSAFASTPGRVVTTEAAREHVQGTEKVLRALSVLLSANVELTRLVPRSVQRSRQQRGT